VKKTKKQKKLKKAQANVLELFQGTSEHGCCDNSHRHPAFLGYLKI